MEIIIIGAIVYYLFSTTFRKKIKRMMDSVEKSDSKPLPKSGIPKTIRDIMDEFRDDARTHRTQSSPSVSTKSIKDKRGTKRPSLTPPPSIEYEEVPIDRVNVPEGGRMEVVKIQEERKPQKSVSVLEQLLGTTEQSKQEQLRKTIILKEIIDRKY